MRVAGPMLNMLIPSPAHPPTARASPHQNHRVLRSCAHSPVPPPSPFHIRSSKACWPTPPAPTAPRCSCLPLSALAYSDNAAAYSTTNPDRRRTPWPSCHSWQTPPPVARFPLAPDVASPLHLD